MSAGRAHRRTLGRERTRRQLARAFQEPPRILGHQGGYEVVSRGQVVFYLPRITPDMPGAMAAAIAIRRSASLSGRCRCGAQMHIRSSRPGHIGLSEMAHQVDCPAGSRHLDEIAERYGWKASW